MQPTEFQKALPPSETTPGHVLVVGAGGIGCPAAWALVGSGVSRVTLVDPDVVELSNLPRQVLFTADDLGLPKAMAAAERLGGGAVGEQARLDHTNASALLRDVDVVIDATDGAPVKDWLNQLCVRRGVPLVHAAGLRSEARLLFVPGGGGPCLACLFGRLEQETGSCADLGVWNGVVGVVGFLAAAAAIDHLRGDTPASAYAVLDFDAGKAFALGADADAACVVCGGTDATVEAYPDDTCGVPVHAESSSVAVDQSLDLEGERCPMNLLRARQTLESAAPGTVIEIRLGEEGAETVPDGVRALGHQVLRQVAWGDGVRLTVEAVAVDARSTFDDETLRRYARQIVLPGIGEPGQQRLFDGSVVVLGGGAAAASAAVYLAAAGVGRIAVPDALPALVDLVNERGRGIAARDAAGAWDVGVLLAGDPHPAAAEHVGARAEGTQAHVVWNEATALPALSVPHALAIGALLANAVQRQLVEGEPRPAPALEIVELASI